MYLKNRLAVCLLMTSYLVTPQLVRADPLRNDIDQASVFSEVSPLSMPAGLDPRALDRTDFEILKPGIYIGFEKDKVAAYKALNKAINERPPLDLDKLVKGKLPPDTPGLGPIVDVTPDWLRYQNDKYDPLNPIRHDRAVAQKAGYRDVPAYPTYAAHDDSVMTPWPPEARDKLLVSDLNHSVTNYLPVYAGDRLFIVINHRDVTDLTPLTGGTRRIVAIESQASIYNQKKQKVSDMTFRVTEHLSIYKDRSKAPVNPTFAQLWEAPDWTARPEHVYTDKDWDFIKSVWAHEHIQGAAPLYWEDVKVGDKPAWTLDGPIEESPTPTWGMGMGSGGSRSIRPEIMASDTFANLVRNPVDGIWRLKNPNLERPKFPPLPVIKGAPPPAPRPGEVNTAEIHKEKVKRAALVNFTGRDYAVRHLTNWMGDDGWLKTISWAIMDPRAHWQTGMPVMPNPAAKHFVGHLPGMAGAHVSVHGLTKDVALVKSEVTGKRITNGAHEVELVWWIENLDGQIWEEGSAVVTLPSRSQPDVTAVPKERLSAAK